MNPRLFAELRSAWEAINNRWNQWVLNYSRGQQLDVLKDLGQLSVPIDKAKIVVTAP